VIYLRKKAYITRVLKLITVLILITPQNLNTLTSGISHCLSKATYGAEVKSVKGLFIYTMIQVNGKYVIKSGTDFRQMCQVTLNFGADGKVAVTTKEITIDSSIPENPKVKDIVHSYVSEYRN
jgi:hypothetical protein